MTTVITELAQSLKAAANTTSDAIDRLKAFPGDELIELSQHEGEQVDIDITMINEWYELSSPANILALLEALEKAQSKIIELQQGYEIDPRTHEIIDLQERIAELESRTVKLPELCVGVVQGGHAVMVPYPAGHWFNKTAILEMLAAAGIKVEAE
ncbi:hypothetical protein RHS46_003324 [Klebsiella pneumoniae]|nr:hypothetical protein [Klebsiella pneumoniae]